MEILPVTPDRLPEALSLCWNVFCQYNAPTFPSEGIGTFHAYLHPNLSALNAKRAVYSSMPHTRNRR